MYSPSRIRRQTGLSLVELMISLVLGLLVIGGALSVFASNKQTFLSTESLGRVQESARVAFELMARDVREAGGNPCAKKLAAVNVINDPTAHWYTNFTAGVTGFDGADALPEITTGTGAGQRIAGTDAIQLKSAQSSGTTVVSHNPTSANFQVNTASHGLSDGDLAIVCDFRELAMFQVTNAQDGINTTVVHNTGNSVSPGNCTKGLGAPLDCTSTNGTPYTFGANSVLAKLHMTQWYVGANPNGGRSLYVVNVSAGGAQPAQEIAENVQDMQITYLESGAATYVSAASVTDWNQILAARFVLTLKGAEKVGTDGSQIERTLSHVVTLRNRNS